MDSGNSGSMQSSSGDEEYDSRAESISVFLNNNNNPLTHVGPISNPPPPPPPPPSNHHHHQTHHTSSLTMFDPLSNFFDPSSSSTTRSLPSSQLTNPFLNLDMVWSKNLRSENNCTDLSALIDSSSSSPTQHFLTNQTQNKPHFPSIQIPQQPPESTLRPSASTSTDQTTAAATPRNPKKRSRASRRAPTTVLTTDTANFRAMVQEFTGIPAPYTSTSFQRTRLDLFGTSSLRSTSTHFDPSPSPNYLLRPSPQKFQPPFSSPSSTNTTTNINTNLLDINLQNPIFNLQSLLPKYPLANSSIIASTTKPQQQQEIGVIQEFGLNHGHGGLQNILSSTDATLRRSENWGGDGRGGSGGGGGSNNESDPQGILRSINGSYNNNSQSVANGDKGAEINLGTRNEGMMEPWICSSD